MRIIINEIKKIFNIKMILLMIAGVLILYKLYASFEIEYFPNGRPDGDTYRITIEMLNKYGTSMDEDEFKDLKIWREEKEIEADKYLSAREEFTSLNIDTYKKFQEKDHEEIHELSNKIFVKEGVDVFWELQVMDSLIGLYEHKDIVIGKSQKKALENRKLEIIEKESNKSILTKSVFDNYNNFIGGFALIILFSIIFMLCPIFIKDRVNKVEYLQYTSSVGRGLFKKKIIAGVISSLLLTIFFIAIAFKLYAGNNTSMFYNCNINGFDNNTFWYDLTFYQYIVITVVLTYILSVITALITMYLSSMATSYIKVIAMIVPIGGSLVYLGYNSIITKGMFVYVSQFKAPIIYAVLIISTCILIVKKLRRTKRVDILY